ncbi:MAG: response regulator [Pseudomonadota bacterium]
METIKVLIVDDEEDFRDTIVKRLNSRNIPALAAPGGKEALAVLEDMDIDVVVLDVKMPGMDGIETLKRIKAAGFDVEVIILTGHAAVDTGIQGMQLGAFDYIMKPASMTEFLDKIRQAYITKTERKAGSVR